MRGIEVGEGFEVPAIPPEVIQLVRAMLGTQPSRLERLVTALLRGEIMPYTEPSTDALEKWASDIVRAASAIDAALARFEPLDPPAPGHLT